MTTPERLAAADTQIRSTAVETIVWILSEDLALVDTDTLVEAASLLQAATDRVVVAPA